MNYTAIKNRQHMQKKRHDSAEFENNTLSGTFGDLGRDSVKKVGGAISEIGKGLFEQLMNSPDPEKYGEHDFESIKDQNEDKPIEKQGNVFSFREIEEERQISEIKNLIEAIKQEVVAIKKADATLMAEVSDIEKLTINSIPERAGIYHIRVLEVFLKLLQSMRTKIGESSSWMQALMSKKKKRGSLFQTNSKKKGTQYSMSQELSNARAVQ